MPEALANEKSWTLDGAFLRCVYFLCPVRAATYQPRATPWVDPVPKQVPALKGPNNLAQGNALGWPVPQQTRALKGRNNLTPRQTIPRNPPHAGGKTCETHLETQLADGVPLGWRGTG